MFELGLAAYEAKEAEIGPELMRTIESQYIMLPMIDRLWVDHLYIMDALKSGIGLRGYGQKDPRVEYEKEAYEIFEDLKNNIADEAIKAIFTMRIEIEAPPPDGVQPLTAGPNGAGAGNGHAAPQFAPLPSGDLSPQPVGQTASQPRVDAATAERLLGPAPKHEATQIHTNRGDAEPAKPRQAVAEKVGRNELCPCGSGKKYKRCHGTA
jgi:preprotein translocase subunit SecA